MFYFAHSCNLSPRAQEVHNTHTVQKGRNRKRTKRSLDERSEELAVFWDFSVRVLSGMNIYCEIL